MTQTPPPYPTPTPTHAPRPLPLPFPLPLTLFARLSAPRSAHAVRHLRPRLPPADAHRLWRLGAVPEERLVGADLPAATPRAAVRVRVCGAGGHGVAAPRRGSGAGDPRVGRGHEGGCGDAGAAARGGRT
eukprot:55245-Chlamydomonas_euryale.AAC.2